MAEFLGLVEYSEEELKVVKKYLRILFFFRGVITFLWIGIIGWLIYVYLTTRQTVVETVLSPWGALVFILLILLLWLKILESDLVAREEKLKMEDELSHLFPAKTQATTGKSDDPVFMALLVQGNMENLRKNYFMVWNHADKSFWVALIVGIIGFFLLCSGLAMAYLGSADGTIPGIASLTSAAGLITEFISSIFFVLHNRTVQQLERYHESLLRVQKITIAMWIQSSIEDAGLKYAAAMEIIKTLMVGGSEIPATEPEKPG